MTSSNERSEKSERHAGGRACIEVLCGQNTLARDRMIGDLRSRLIRFAARRLSGGGARREAESVVQSVIGRQDWRTLGEQCNDDAHLRRRLYQAVRHKLHDDAKKKRPVRMPRDKDGETAVHPATPGPGPVTELVNHESRQASQDQAKRFLELLRSDRISASHRQLVELYVIRELAWSQIARVLGSTERACKVALSRARSAVLPVVFEPLRQGLSPREWAVAEKILVLRRPEEEVTEMLGLESDELHNIFATRIVPAIINTYGKSSVDPILRLSGYLRR